MMLMIVMAPGDVGSAVDATATQLKRAQPIARMSGGSAVKKHTPVCVNNAFISTRLEPVSLHAFVYFQCVANQCAPKLKKTSV